MARSTAYTEASIEAQSRTFNNTTVYVYDNQYIPMVKLENQAFCDAVADMYNCDTIEVIESFMTRSGVSEEDWDDEKSTNLIAAYREACTSTNRTHFTFTGKIDSEDFFHSLRRGILMFPTSVAQMAKEDKMMDHLLGRTRLTHAKAVEMETDHLRKEWDDRMRLHGVSGSTPTFFHMLSAAQAWSSELREATARKLIEMDMDESFERPPPGYTDIIDAETERQQARALYGKIVNLSPTLPSCLSLPWV